jgi:hypothetical protein
MMGRTGHVVKQEIHVENKLKIIMGRDQFEDVDQRLNEPG